MYWDVHLTSRTVAVLIFPDIIAQVRGLQILRNAPKNDLHECHAHIGDEHN